jgi:hypothetical protein
VLLKLLETSRDSTTLAVGCLDLAQFVSHVMHGEDALLARPLLLSLCSLRRAVKAWHATLPTSLAGPGCVTGRPFALNPLKHTHAHTLTVHLLQVAAL